MHELSRGLAELFGEYLRRREAMGLCIRGQVLAYLRRPLRRGEGSNSNEEAYELRFEAMCVGDRSMRRFVHSIRAYPQ